MLLTGNLDRDGIVFINFILIEESAEIEGFTHFSFKGLPQIVQIVLLFIGLPNEKFDNIGGIWQLALLPDCFFQVKYAGPIEVARPRPTTW